MFSIKDEVVADPGARTHLVGYEAGWLPSHAGESIVLEVKAEKGLGLALVRELEEHLLPLLADPAHLQVVGPRLEAVDAQVVGGRGVAAEGGVLALVLQD
jgi:hypothetical protein